MGRGMNKSTQQQRPAAPAKPKRTYRNNRRRVIVSALRQCILRQGYADTTITDIANAADLSLSHLLYYYPGKDEILIDLVTEHHSRISETMRIEQTGDPIAMIDAMVDKIFIATAAEELTLLRAFVGLAAHKPELNAILEKYAVVGFRQFEQIFELVPRQADLSPEDAANLAGALWLGLMIQIDVRSARDEAKTRRLLRTALMRMARLDGEDALRW
jgi:AcrR family transcriptional regulator